MSAGEVQSITWEEHQKLTDWLVEEGAGRSITIAGCTSPDTKEVVRRARYAQEVGADAIAVALPYFVPLNKAEAYHFFIDVAEACSEVGIIHYQTPRCGTLLNAEDYLKLAEIPNFLGSKQTGTNLDFLMELSMATPQLSHMRVESLFPDLMVGASGCVSSTATLNPMFILQLYNHCLDQKWDLALKMQCQIKAFHKGLWEIIPPIYLDPVIDKALTDIAGFITAGDPRKPFLPLPNHLKLQLRHFLETYHPQFLYQVAS